MKDLLIACESSMIAAFIAEGLMTDKKPRFIHVRSQEDAWMHIVMADPAAIIFNEELNCSAWIKNFRSRGCQKIIHLEVSKKEWQAFAESFIADPLTVVLAEPNIKTLAIMLDPLLQDTRAVAF